MCEAPLNVYLFILTVAFIAIIFLIFGVFYLKKKSTKDKRLCDFTSFINKGINIFLFRDIKTFIFLGLFFSLFIYIQPGSDFKRILFFIEGLLSGILVVFFCVKFINIASFRILEIYKNKNLAITLSYCVFLTISLFIFAVSIAGITSVLIISNNINVNNRLLSYAFGTILVAFIFNFRGVFYKNLDSFDMDKKGKKRYLTGPVYYAYLVDIICCHPSLISAFMFTMIVISVISPIFIAFLLSTPDIINLSNIAETSNTVLILLPLQISLAGLVSIFITLILTYLLKEYRLRAFVTTYLFVNISIVLCFDFIITLGLGVTIKIYWVIFIGVCEFFLAGLIGVYYMTETPVLKAVIAAKKGPAFNLLKGVSSGLESTAFFAIIICSYIILANYWAGIYGVSIILSACFILTGLVFLPLKYNIIDNYINEILSFLKYSDPEDYKKDIDNLDGKRMDTFCLNISNNLFIFISIVLFFVCYINIKGDTGEILNTDFLVGAILGGVIPFFICSLVITGPEGSVFNFLNEVGRQFKENPEFLRNIDIVKYHLKFCIDLLLDSSSKKLILSLCISIMLPIVIGLSMGRLALLGLLTGLFVTASVISVFITNAYGMWSSLRNFVAKYISSIKTSQADFVESIYIGEQTGIILKETIPAIIKLQVNLIYLVSLIMSPVVFSLWD